MDSTPVRTAPEGTIFHGAGDDPETQFLRETLTGALYGFKRSGAPEIGRKRIDIIDRAQLEQVVEQRPGCIA